MGLVVAAKMIEIRNLKKYFPLKGGFFNSKQADVKAVEKVNFDIPEGEILGLVGESGSGKTTLGRSIISCLLYTSPSPRDQRGSRMPSSA